MVKTKLNLTQLSSGIIVPLLVIAIGAAGYFLLWPQYRDTQGKRQALADKKAAVAEREAELASIQALVSDLNEKRAELEIAEEALPKEPDMPQLLATLDNIATLSGIFIASLQPALPAQKAGDNLGIVQITLTLKGRYENLRAFLLNAEQNLRLFDVKSVIFSPIDESLIQEYNLVINTYYQKPYEAASGE
ncbi:MAG: type 4a pilus biogenesis protein PilO [Candidatus Doudnabacteria bacterium]|nr:type 4a pilus biogenesis protein PilO [Candidatus Doudnabacteria bacterium]